MKKNLFSLLLLLLIVPHPARAFVTFDSGGTIDFSGVDPTGSAVRDGPGGQPTTVNFLAGTDLGPTDVEGSSRLNVLAGSMVDDFDVLGSGRLEISGGSHGGVDFLEASSGSITGGSFAGCFPCLRLFGQASAIVTGGSFSSPSQIVASTDDFATLEIRSGDFTGFVRANDDSLIEIRGGAIERVQSLDQATVILFGDGFVAVEGSTTVVDGFGEISDGFNGTITGQLSDGSPLSVTALNGVVGSRIVLASGALPVPALSPFADGGLLLGLLVASSWATLLRERRVMARSRS